MKKSKLINILKTFSAIELREFGDFLKSPIFNKQEELVFLYTYLYNQAPRFLDEKMDRKLVFKAIFPNSPFNQSKFYFLAHTLLKLAEDFLGWKLSAKTGEFQDYYIAKACLERGLEKNYKEKWKRCNRYVEAGQFQDTTYFQNRFLLAELANHFYLKQNLREEDTNLEEASDNFDIYFLCKKLPLACEILARNRSLSTDVQIGLREELRSHLEKEQYLHVPFVAIYRQIFFMLTEEDKEDRFFYDFKKLLDEHISKIGVAELSSIFQYGINYCVQQIRSAKPHFIEEALNFYLRGLESGVLLQKGEISPWDFKNIIRLGLNLKRYDWTENFIQTYSEKLPAQFQQDALNYNMADLYYYKGEWNKTIELLNNVSFTDLSYRLGTRFLLCKIYYETNAENALLSMLAAFRIFLKRDRKMATDLKKSYLNLLKYINLLLKVKNKKELENMKTEIENLPLLVERTWLLKMLAQKMNG